MKYIREKNGKREVVERRKHSRAYMIQAALKWAFCIGALALVILTCQMLDKKLNDGKIVDKLLNTSANIPPASDTESVLPIETEEAETPQDVLSVCLDPGHGGMDPGCDYEGRIESEDVWKLALAVKSEMESQGIEVIMTREDNDTKVFLTDRVEIANESGVDYYISLHRNKGEGYGIETWMSANAGAITESLTNNIHNAIVEAGVQRDRGVKTGSEGSESSDYAVLKNTKMPACLVEFGFINDAEDNRLYDANIDAYAKAITEAVQKTYAQYGEQDDSTAEPAEGEEDSAEDSGKNGMILDYTPIENVSSLDNELLNWGQGTNVDEYNRPTGSLSYQEKFKDYPADFIIPTTSKTIYLTFDEGYEYGCTPTILNTLREKDVKAVFFVTQPYAKTDPDLVQQMLDDGHILGNHSVTHPANGLPSQTIEEQQNEIMGLHNYIKETYNYDMYLFRYPAGKFSEQSLAVLNNCGYRGVFWSFAYLDYDVENQPDEAESLQKMVDRLHPGAIYLLHAESWTNTNVLGSFIDQARAAGYEFGVYSDTLK